MQWERPSGKENCFLLQQSCCDTFWMNICDGHMFHLVVLSVKNTGFWGVKIFCENMFSIFLETFCCHPNELWGFLAFPLTRRAMIYGDPLLPTLHAVCTRHVCNFSTMLGHFCRTCKVWWSHLKRAFLWQMCTLALTTHDLLPWNDIWGLHSIIKPSIAQSHWLPSAPGNSDTWGARCPFEIQTANISQM